MAGTTGRACRGQARVADDDGPTVNRVANDEAWGGGPRGSGKGGVRGWNAGSLWQGFVIRIAGECGVYMQRSDVIFLSCCRSVGR